MLIKKDLSHGYFLILAYMQSLSFAFQWMLIITLLIKKWPSGHTNFFTNSEKTTRIAYKQGFFFVAIF
ncbi:hypothetical protein BGP_5605 [Beggiatoa sp. PS]|nr:hypothetical protein BGP_5605 [Beggiatoa sp. PS]